MTSEEYGQYIDDFELDVDVMPVYVDKPVIGVGKVEPIPTAVEYTILSPALNP